MKLITIGCMFWMAQFVYCNFISLKNLERDNPCPCVPFDECSNELWPIFYSKKVLILRCETANLVRCCSTVPKSIELANKNGSPWEPKNDTDLKTSMQPEDIIEEDSTSMLQISTPFLEESAWDVPVNADESEGLSSTDISTVKSENVTHADLTEDPIETAQNFQNDTVITDVNQVPLQHPRQEFLTKPRLMRIKVPSNGITASSISNFRASENMEQDNLKVKKTDQLVIPVSPPQQSDEEDSYSLDLIYKARVFESRRVVPKQPDLFLDSARGIKSVPSDTVVLNNSYFNMNLRALPAARSLFEKMSDLLKQKTSLEKALTPDGASAQATNENASPLSELDVVERDDTSNGNLLHPEDVEDVKRVARRHTSEPNEGAFKFLSSRLEAASQTETESIPIKRFRRPPRILPTRNQPNEEHDSHKFANSKERARSLFNKSNEARRKQVSLLINRNDSNPKKLNSTKTNYSTTEITEIEGNSSDKNADSSIEGRIGYIDEDRKDVDEIGENKNV